MNPSSGHCRWIRPLRNGLLLAVAGFPMLPAAATGLPQATAASVPETGGEELYLEVVLNQARKPDLFHFVRRGARFFATPGTLRRLGLVVPGGDDGMRALDAFAGVVVTYDANRQLIAIDAPLSQLSLTTTVLNQPEDGLPVVTDTAPGLLFNYDLYASQQDAASNVTASTELRLFGVGNGVFSNTAVTRSYRLRGEGWHGETVRLDSNWQLSFPESAVTVTVGDTYSGFLDWARTVRLGGVQIARNYGLQPYRITTPLPAFLGEVAVPSAVDLYVNGIRQYSGELPVGPFQLATVPGITGAGNAQIVITDAFGRTRTLEFPFYATQRLLAKGLSDWSLTAGVVREAYGQHSFAYASQPVASGNLRYGVNDSFTMEAHAETGDGLANGGLGGVWLLGRAGVFSAAYAGSSLDGLHGAQTAVAYAWNDGRFNVSADSRRRHGDYRDVASLYGALPPDVSQRALAGVTTPRLGNLSLSYVRLGYAGEDTSRYAGAFWSRSFAHGWSANFSINQNLGDHDDRSAYLGISVALGGNRQASASWQRNGGRDAAVADLARPVSADGGFGWRLQARDGDGGGGGLAEGTWIGDAGRYGLGFASFDGDSYGYASASGGMVLMGGHAFASRNIGDAFAVVSTDGIAGVPVMLENRPIGVTDANGMLLVTPLNAWQRNKLSIDPMDLPANVRIAAVETMATPRDRSGARVRFPITPVRAAVVVLHDMSGHPLPVGSDVRIMDRPEVRSVVGYDGETYLDALDKHTRLQVLTLDGACNVEIDYPAIADAIARIGPLSCNPEVIP